MCIHSDNKNYVCPYCDYKKVYVKSDENSVGMKAIFIRKESK